MLRRWIAEGAAFEPHWSFVPPQRHALPIVAKAAQSRGPIDHFVLQRLEAEQLEPLAEAKKLGIPVIGPVSHRDIDVTSAYFQSPEGHKLEICTWDPYPVEKTTPGRIDFPSLAHDWPNVKTV